MIRYLVITALLVGCGSKDDGETKTVEKIVEVPAEPEEEEESELFQVPGTHQPECDKGWPIEIKPLTSEEVGIKNDLNALDLGDTWKDLSQDMKDLLLGDRTAFKEYDLAGCEDFQEFEFSTYYGTGDSKFYYFLQFCDGVLVNKKYCDPDTQ